MKFFCSYACLIAIAILMEGLAACNNSHPSSSGNEIAASISDAQSVNIQRPDPFFLQIKGENALIVPGKAIGRLEVGEKTDSLQPLGEAQKGDAGMCKSLGRWFYGDSALENRKEVDVFSECDPDDDMRPHIKWIRTTDPAFKTKSGIGVNSSYKEIKTTYADLKPVATYTAQTDSAQMVILNATGKGITFEITAKNMQPKPEDSCRAIIVHNAKHTMPSMYFSFYDDLKLQPKAANP